MSEELGRHKSMTCQSRILLHGQPVMNSISFVTPSFRQPNCCKYNMLVWRKKQQLCIKSSLAWQIIMGHFYHGSLFSCKCYGILLRGSLIPTCNLIFLSVVPHATTIGFIVLLANKVPCCQFLQCLCASYLSRQGQEVQSQRPTTITTCQIARHITLTRHSPQSLWLFGLLTLLHKMSCCYHFHSTSNHRFDGNWNLWLKD